MYLCTSGLDRVVRSINIKNNYGIIKDFCHIFRPLLDIVRKEWNGHNELKALYWLNLIDLKEFAIIIRIFICQTILTIDGVWIGGGIYCI
jgi:hypothetical protein